MPREIVIFWTLAIAGATLAGWWLVIRPDGSRKSVARPVGLLIVLLALLLCALSLMQESGGSQPARLYGLLHAAG